MNEPLSIYGKSFRVGPDADDTSVDRKWPEPELGRELLTETYIYHSAAMRCVQHARESCMVKKGWVTFLTRTARSFHLCSAV